MTDAPILPDVLAEGLDVVFCGLNPGLAAAGAGHHFLGRGNRFWRVIHLAGFTPEEMRPEDDRAILRHRCGLTTVVERPTARADQIAMAEFADAATRFERKIARHAPRFVAFLGKAAFSTLSSQREITWGCQAGTFGGALAWVLPNPSGRNRAFSLDELVSAYRQLHDQVVLDS
ncbi:G/U mismatch-specific DNA glycosylase [Azospirillum sp. B4]|uniref:G/U mismatch-specific DNA glycosylase n=1 Tax=Azospirillum sp. B4 TaxID=95605 RepID=UPI0005C985B9|nr:G/U mismatch-specific DNA glycosylase [Azospirillum sp. B4]